MTNKELADQLENWPTMESEMFAEAARRLRSLPDPTPEPVKDLRWLVGRHECLSKHLSYMPGMEYGPWSWDYRGDNTSGSIITGHAARVVVRGIVKGLCVRRGSWDLSLDPARSGKWLIVGFGCLDYYDTELEAIDALLTAMEQGK